MTNEEMDFKLIKVGLPIYGTAEEKLERLYRNNIIERPELKEIVDKPVEPAVKVIQRGRPKKV